ncbi:hypothetical protein K435DRAFT_850147 [Dendrothele bispora CBS 962.96]|uniref:Borealin N-terminal domain-containing protein n=1 Tax=Dendrothele bispora (strain CBS 962.96) TaxID=1314807 RepID=A0A4S8MQS6_DENBC|nr:hypothetical protein K435DRAFT_850147 [Dendrothele bispora CBS 962.96]
MYSEDDKKQLLHNLDIEVRHRTTQFREWLNDCLDNFNIHQEGHVSRIPKQVRSLTMREFCTKYNGNVQLALRGVQKERLAALGEDNQEVDRTARKRKWVASQEEDKVSKNARLTSPVKKAPAQRPRPLATPGKSTTRPPFSTGTRRGPTSPAKPSTSSTTATSQPRSRVPSSSTFNPVLPTKTPGYPPRLPRKDENMIVSVNGSPLANPFCDAPPSHPAPPTLRRTNSSISIRRDPSFLVNSTTSTGLHFRSQSQASSRPHSSTSTHVNSTSHSRSNSEITLASPTDPFTKFQFPLSKDKEKYKDDSLDESTTTKTPLQKSKSTYTVTLSTYDGHLLEFDPLLTSPGELDSLEGISDEAKRQAKEEMARLVRAAMNKWKIG